MTEAEEEHLHIFVHRGKANARSITRARVLLKLSEGWSDEQITAALRAHDGSPLWSRTFLTDAPGFFQLTVVDRSSTSGQHAWSRLCADAGWSSRCFANQRRLHHLARSTPG
jgi:hypothetical protein